jgi:hypothetical protein
MGFPKQIKKNIELTPYRTLYPRRVELLDKINEHGTFLPKSILHADLDGGFLDFVKNDLKVVTEGNVIPTTDILITTQNWAQFTQTWNFQDLDKNVSPPFITVVRAPEIKYGTLPSLQWTIPNRKQFYYASVPSFDGDRINVDVYKIPQPVPVDIKYSVKIICNRMRELNALNKTILQKFSSRQAYTQIKGHYIPIIMDNVSDESVMDVEKRKYYIQSYDFTMMGFLMDEDEFEVKPGVERVFQLFEVNQSSENKKRRSPSGNPKNYNTTIEFVDENVLVVKRFYDKVDLTLIKTNNVESYDVFVNDEYYGINPIKIQLNPDSVVRFEIVKDIPNQTSTIEFQATIV